MSANPEHVQNLVYFYQWLLALVRYDDLNKLVTSANTRHAPLFAIVAFTDFRTCLERAATYLENPPIVSAGISSFQHGGGTSDKKKKEKRGNNKNTNKVDKKSVSYSDKKDSKKDKDTCDLISISYKGQSDSVEAYRKLTHVIPWYEYCLYVFRHELMISECRAKGVKISAPNLDISTIDKVIIVFNKMKTNLSTLYTERYTLATKINFASLGVNESNGERSFAMAAVPGFFIVSTPSPMFVKVESINEPTFRKAFLERSLEYAQRIPLDRFLILYNGYFSSILYTTIAQNMDAFHMVLDTETGNVKFTLLTYTLETDMFVLSNAKDFSISFRINSEQGGLPIPIIFGVNTSYHNYNIDNINKRDNNKSNTTIVTIFDDVTMDTSKLISSWVETDAMKLWFNHSVIGNKAL
eukprot:gene25500-11156_t